jgi:hypothetical protein
MYDVNGFAITRKVYFSDSWMGDHCLDDLYVSLVRLKGENKRPGHLWSNFGVEMYNIQNTRWKPSLSKNLSDG